MQRCTVTLGYGERMDSLDGLGGSRFAAMQWHFCERGSMDELRSWLLLPYVIWILLFDFEIEA